MPRDDSFGLGDDASVETVLDRISDAVYALDTDWQFTFCNEHAADLLASDPETLLGQTLWEAFPDAAEGLVGEEFRTAMETGESTHFDIYYEPLSRWFSVRAHPSDTGLTVVFRDLADEGGRDLDLQRKQRLFEAVFEQTADALIVADSDRRITDLNPTAESLFGYETAAVVGRPVSMLYGEPIGEDDDTTPSSDQPYVLTYERADGTTFEGETLNTTLTGPSGTTLATLASIRDVSSRMAYERQIEARNDALRRFHAITTDEDRSLDATIEAMLALSVDYLDVEIGLFASIDGGQYTVEAIVPDSAPVTAGDSFDLDETYCKQVAAADAPVTFTNGPNGEIADNPAYGTDGFQTYLGVPVVVDDTLYGTLCFAAHDDRDAAFTDGDTAFAQIAAQWLGSELSSNAFEAKLTALNETARQLMAAESRDEIAEITAKRAAVVLDLPLTGIWWYDGHEALVPATQTAAATELIGDQPPFHQGDAAAWEAFADGEARVYDDLTDAAALHNDETVFGSEVLVPLGDHGILVTGATTAHAFSETDRTLIDVLAATVTAALDQAEREAILRETQAELEAANEELALLNQVVRHDIKNDVAVILGHSRSLADRLDGSAADSLQPVLRAATHITDITETVGEFLDVLGSDAEPALKPIDLIAVLTDECRKARRTYDDADIRIDNAFPTGIEVAATELLSSVFRNLITNAITHNDKPTPEVVISGKERGDNVVIRIADNGPGIPADRRDEIFGRGEHGLESPGSGIGLYLVDTLTEIYDGDIEIGDNDPEGSVFTLTLRKAESS